MKATFTLSVSAITLPDATCPSARAQKCRFCARKARKRGVEGKKRTKISILCSKRPKMWVLKGKSAQKPRFCARNARKQGFRRPKAHKNANFVLETPENGGSEGKMRTKTSILCSGGSFGMGLIPVPIVSLRRVARNLLRLWRMRWLGRI